METSFSRCSLYARSGSNPRLPRLTNVYFGQQRHSPTAVPDDLNEPSVTMTDSYPAQAVDKYITLGRSFHIRWSTDALEVRPFNQNKIQTGSTNMNKNATSTISSASGVLAADEVPSIITGRTKSQKNVKGEIRFDRIQISLWDSTEILLGFAGFIAVLYLAGAAALGLALLYNTFTR